MASFPLSSASGSTREARGLFYGVDRWAVLLILVLACIGWLAVHSAVYNEEHPSLIDLSQSYGKQMVWMGTAFVLACIILSVNFRLYETMGYPIYGFAVLMLVATIFIGTNINGSHSWIKVGEFSIQPAEFAKFATCMALAHYLGNMEAQLKSTAVKLSAALIMLLPAAIIILQKETGSALVYVSFILVLHREGLSGNYLLFGFLAAVLSVLALVLNQYALVGVLGAVCGATVLFATPFQRRRIWLPTAASFVLGAVLILGVDWAFQNVLQDHQRTRINILLGREYDPRGAGYNVHQSMIAIGSGGLFGKGYLQGTQTKYDYVPEQSTDFIFCTIGEEFGFVGCAAVLLLFGLLIARLIALAEKQPNAFARIYGYGVASILLFHVIVNVGMTIGLVPVIGIPLPFISYGGSSMWSFTILVFIFLRLDASRKVVLR